MRYCFICDVKKVLGFLYSLGSERIELETLTYKVATLLALTRSSRAHEICYLDILYLIKHSSRIIVLCSNKHTEKKIQKFAWDSGS